MFNNTLHGKVWKQDADPGSAAGDDDIWIQTSGGGVTPINMKVRYAGAWITSPTVPGNSDLVSEGSTNLYLSSTNLFAAATTLGQVKTLPGYATIPGGVRFQWKHGTAVTAEGSQTITFPVTFPNATFTVLASCLYPTNDATTNATFQVVSFTTSQVIVRAQSDAGSWSNGVTPIILAIGF